MPSPLLRGSSVAAALCAFLTATTALAAHTFDLDGAMPARLSIMFSMSWFGVKTSDPQGPGTDPGYGNWLQNFPACGLSNDPASCDAFQDAGLQRSIASKRRPLAGIYSSSGRDPSSLNRIDLMLSTLRSACDTAGGFDAWAIQVDSVKFTSAYPQNAQSPTWDLAYRALESFYAEADKAGLANAVVAGDDATVYWHFGSSWGLTTQAQRLAALQADIADLATGAAAHASAVKVQGKPLLALYVDSGLVTPAEMQGVLDGARGASGVDFYALGTTLDSTFYAAFDALTPWVNLGIWANTDASDSNLRARSAAYAKALHAQLVNDLPTYPGRVMFGALSPGFDDYTENWGACQARELPRDPDVLAGQVDYLTQMKTGGFDLRGTYMETWDDWTEGSEFEPDVTEGTSKLIGLREGLGSIFGDTVDPIGEATLSARWQAFGQPLNCCFAGGACGDAGLEEIALGCPAGRDGGSGGDAAMDPTDAGQTDAVGPAPDAASDAARAVDAGEGGAGAHANPSAPAPGSSGCGCRMSPGNGASGWAAALAASVALLARRRSERGRTPRRARVTRAG